jgi:RNA polymerase sigma-70 factor (ECF subfamily)
VKGLWRLTQQGRVPMSLVRSSAPGSPQVLPAVPDLETLYREHAGTVARWVAHLGGPRVDVDDLVHEIFLVAGRRLPEFRSEAKVTTWLYRITERVVRGARRKQKVRRWLKHARRWDVEAALVPAHPTPVEELERRQARETVYGVLDRLPEKYRRVLILFEMEEMSGEEIAALTGIKLATVWVRLHRGRAQFLAELRREDGGRPCQ